MAGASQVPNQIQDVLKIAHARFPSTNGLVPDPVALLAEEERERPWSEEEKRIFKDRFMQSPKARPLNAWGSSCPWHWTANTSHLPPHLGTVCT